MRIKHRTVLRTKELRELVKRFKEHPNLIHRTLRDLPIGKVSVERSVLEDKSELFLVEGELWLVQLKTIVFPGLPALISENVQLPQVVVDMGAVPHIANGADVMAPGIFSLDEILEVDALAVVIDQKNLIPLAVGRMLMTPSTILEVNKGRAIQTLHYVGDPIWTLAKELSQ